MKPLLCLVVACLGCTAASFGIGAEEIPTDAAETSVDAVTDTRADDTGSQPPDRAEDAEPEATEVLIDAPPEIAPETSPPDTIKPVEIGPEVPPSRCAGKGVPAGKVAVLFHIPPCCARPIGCLTFAASVDGGSWKDPFCSAGTVAANDLTCDFGSASKVQFLVGVADACGGATDPGAPITGASGATYLACKGEVELGYCDSAGCSGKLSWSGSKLTLSP